MKILLINHRSEVMERQRLVLSQNIDACEITACRPGLTLLEVNEKIIPDIAILQADGYSLYCLDMVDHLIEKNPQVYILLISESKDQQLLEQALEAGVDDFITGPPSDTELLLRVKKGLLYKPKKGQAPRPEKEDPLPRKNAPLKQGLLAAVIRVAGNVVFGLIVLFMAVTAFFLVQSKFSGEIPSVFGYRVYMVLSGSMSPTFDTGSVVFVRPQDPAEIRKGDIITYSGEGSGMLTTHRVVDVLNEEGLKFVTRGDANNVNDPKPVPAENVVGRVHGSLPYIGYLMGFAQTRQGLIFLVFIPGTLVILFEIRNIFKYMREAEEERKGERGRASPCESPPAKTA
ncbi:MAG: signal peptidase I [Dethiobacteria bacterium]|nr:signal peptidase I [Bacillota bacterium]HOL16432.1 signal peptidase I [Bacillota bacterium]HQE10917.1 signal peptidase I [Bacillota bacterium]